MRFEVPQFIEIEDKIIGPLTWKQFVYLAGGAGILVMFYLTLPFIVFVILGLPFGTLAASLAFHRVNNRPFSIFIESFVNYFTKGKLYLWRRGHVQSVIEKSKPDMDSGPAIEYTNKKSISSLSRKLEFNVLEK